jgi:hypothetical protein
MKKIVFLNLLLLTLSSSSVFASDLNGVETGASASELTPTTKIEQTEDANPTSNQHLQEQEDTAKAVGDMFGQAGVDQESIETAHEFLRPFAKIMNLIMAGILGITSLLMMFVSVIDLFYMAFPPVRDLLDGGMHGQQQKGRGQRGMGGPRGMQGMRGQGMTAGMQNGMNMDMTGGLGMGNQDMQQSAPGGGFSALGRWVSDEAIAACVDSQTLSKSMIFSYLKKRSLFLIIFGVCVISFTSTVFTDLGIKFGIWILNTISGF